MRAVRSGLFMLVTGAGVALAGCAANSGSAGADATSFTVPIEVENNVSGLTGTSIYIARSSGTGRRLLGPVESGRKRTFQYDAKEGLYRLTAREQGVRADSIVSEPFQIQPGMVIQWSIPANRLLTGTR
jgi:hypothetical protein